MNQQTMLKFYLPIQARIVFIGFLLLTSCSSSDVIPEEGEIFTGEEIQIDPTPDDPPLNEGNPELEDIVSIEPLFNPDRGYHVESIYRIDNTKGLIYAPYSFNPANPVEYPNGFMEAKKKEFFAENDGISLTQLYIYLTDWWQQDQISEGGMENIKTLLEGLKKENVKAILRFAYKGDWGGAFFGKYKSDKGGNPGYERTAKHIKQLEPLLREYWGVIAVIQSGFIGTWGEWGGDMYSAEINSKIMNELLKIIPKPYNMEIRRPPYKNSLVLDDPSDFDRIGYNNDYFTAGEHSHASGNDYVPGDNQYKQVAKESYNVYVSGELPYAENSEWGLHALISTDVSLAAFKAHHYSALDITQNNELNLAHWKEVKVYPELLRRIKILFDINYFVENGKVVPRSLYQFVRDHLGYRLNLLKTSTLSAKDGNLIYDLQLTNTGFATVLNPKPVYLVLIDKNNQIVKQITLSNVNPKNWQPFASDAKSEVLTHHISGSTPVTGLSGTFKAGLWIPDSQSSVSLNAAYDVKFALDNRQVTHWKDADNNRTVNVVGEVTFE